MQRWEGARPDSGGSRGPGEASHLWSSGPSIPVPILASQKACVYTAVTSDLLKQKTNHDPLRCFLVTIEEGA